MIRRATESEAEALMRLINRAFEVERFFLDTDRIDLPRVLEFFGRGCFLVEEDGGGAMAACIYVEIRGARGYFGLLSVDPGRQGRGLGKRLIAAAENFARDAGCAHMDLRIVNLREELPPFYQKLGYVEFGRSEFPADVETKLPCYFIDMSKPLKA